jgi:hypothetical protein
MQTMTSASCDADVAELSGLRHRTRPGKEIYITAVAARKSAAGKQLQPAMSLPGHFLSVREDLGDRDWSCSATGKFPRNIAGRKHATGRFTGPGNGARATLRVAR